MDAKELRIGNWYGEFSVPKQVTPDLILKLHQIEMAGQIAIDVSPIPLSEEWLLKFGFDKDSDNEYLMDVYNTDVAFYTFNADFIYNKILYKGGKWALITAELIYNYNVQYVHQLQNIYFALTGEELIYNERKISQRL